MRIRTVTVAFVVSSLLWSTSATAQQHVVEPAALRQAVANQIAVDQQNREVVIGLLNRSDVRTVAGRLGLNVARAEAAVTTVSGAELASLADTARTVNADLTGGANTVVISVTALLLIIIIVILLVD